MTVGDLGTRLFEMFSCCHGNLYVAETTVSCSAIIDIWEITSRNVISDISDHYSQLCIIKSFKVKELT